MFDINLSELVANELPKILQKLKDKGIEMASDDERLLVVLEKAYELLPTPVRLVVKRDTFFKFCLENKNKLLDLGKEETKAKISAKPAITPDKKVAKSDAPKASTKPKVTTEKSKETVAKKTPKSKTKE